jgi:hypothetical protein
VNEHDLRRLADEPGGHTEHRRPVAAVLHRSRQLQRRRRAVHGLGAGVLIAGLVGAGAWARQPDRETDLATVSPTPPQLCSRNPEPLDEADAYEVSEGYFVYADPIPFEEANGLLFLPTDLPEGLEITEASAWRYDSRCPDGPLLALQAAGGDSTVDATIKLLGPYSEPFDGPHYSDGQTSAATRLRGVAATRITVPRLQGYDGEETLLAFTWTDATGATWLLESQNVDEATLRSVGEALLLDPSSAPPADIPVEALPAGWDLTWRFPTLPTSLDAIDPETTSWNVELGEPPGGCSLRFASTSAAEAPERAFAGPDHEVVTVRGQDGLKVGDRSLRWNEPSGASVLLYCGTETEGLVAMAESLEPIEPDDPRLP